MYLEDVRSFCPLLRTDLRLSAFLDSAAKKSGAGAMCVALRGGCVRNTCYKLHL